MGIRNSAKLDPSSNIVRVLIDMFVESEYDVQQSEVACLLFQFIVRQRVNVLILREESPNGESHTKEKRQTENVCCLSLAIVALLAVQLIVHLKNHFPFFV
jgi:hypothetical protein